MDVVDEDAFFQWKEDITQEYPGKGQALFQVCVVAFRYHSFTASNDMAAFSFIASDMHM